MKAKVILTALAMLATTAAFGNEMLSRFSSPDVCYGASSGERTEDRLVWGIEMWRSFEAKEGEDRLSLYVLMPFRHFRHGDYISDVLCEAEGEAARCTVLGKGSGSFLIRPMGETMILHFDSPLVLERNDERTLISPARMELPEAPPLSPSLEGQTIGNYSDGSRILGGNPCWSV